MYKMEKEKKEKQETKLLIKNIDRQVINIILI